MAHYFGRSVYIVNAVDSQPITSALNEIFPPTKNILRKCTHIDTYDNRVTI